MKITTKPKHMENTAMQDLLEYVKTTRSLTFLPDQLAKLIEDKYIPKSMRDIRDAFNNGEANVWDRERDGNIFEYENGDDYYKKTYKQI
jgi:hypothetical protein